MYQKAMDIARGLMQMHSNGFLHRDFIQYEYCS